VIKKFKGFFFSKFDVFPVKESIVTEYSLLNNFNFFFLILVKFHTLGKDEKKKKNKKTLGILFNSTKVLQSKCLLRN
jgi:hypothetical protein